MQRMPSQILLYEKMYALSARMAEAARAGDWETLAGFERAIAALRDAPPANDDHLPEAELRHKILLIQRILDDDAEISRHTEPWMDHLLRLIGKDTHDGKSKRPCNT